MSIIELETPWCFNTMSLEQSEVRELQKYFVNKGNHQYDWQNSYYCGITSDGLSEYFCSPEYFDENAGDTKVYTVEQLRAIIAEHLAKQPVKPKSVTQFEVGKWYKYNKHVGKFSGYVDGLFTVSEYIYKNKHYVEPANWGSKLVDNERELIEDLSKIQDLLPDGHPDKQTKVYLDDKGRPLKEFKIGSWYTNPCFKRKHSNGNPACFFRVSSCKREVSYDGEYYFNTLEFDEVADKDWNIEVCKNSHSNINYDQEMVEVFPPTRSERYLETMKFFEQLREPERSEAIANYDESFSTHVPKTLYDAVFYGFDFCKVPQKLNYWDDLRYMIDEKTYFKEELLVFGKYKVGDIVVKTGRRDNDKAPRHQPGNIVKVHKRSKSNLLCFDEHWQSNRDDHFRSATPEEIEAYNQGVRNIADIKPKDYKEAVHCTTQEEWDFVLSKFNNDDVWPKSSKMITSSSWSQYKKDSYINTERGSFGDVNGTGEDWGYTILTFKQWCEKYGHSYEVVPEYVECVNSKTHHYKEGKIYTWPDTITEECKPNKPDILKGGVWEFKPSTKEAYDEQQGKLKMEELLSEAKRRYPAGTKVRAVVDGPKLTTEVFTLTDSHYWASGSQAPACYTEEGHPVCLHLSGIWAEIIKEEPKPTEIKPAKGMYVRCLKENSWGDGKTKVGQVFEIQDIDSDGDFSIENQLFIKNRLKAGEFELLPDYKEKPWVAQVGDWVYVLDKGTAYKLKEGEIRKCVQVATSDEEIALSEKQPGYWLKTGEYRKATQEEIDSVTKQVSKGLGLPLVPEWTSDNWYVEVSSQEEANAVIDAASKMYGEPYDKTYGFDDDFWKYVSLCCQDKKYSLLSRKFIHIGAKPRPITDFIQPEITRVPDEIDCISSISLRPEECYKSQQDELVIYKPKQTRFVEPGAVSASVSTTNLIIKSNSKYL